MSGQGSDGGSWGGGALRLRDVAPPEPAPWNPLDGVSPPDYVPPYWTPEHVQRRLADAFVTLRRLPARVGPQAFGSAMPAYLHEFSDLVAQEQQEEEERKRGRAQRNRACIAPSAEAVDQMNEALAWPLRYLEANPREAKALQLWALCKARRADAKPLCRRVGLPYSSFKALRARGAKILAERLRAARRPVW